MNSSTHHETVGQHQERPLNWPVAERPLRVAMLGWARLSQQAREGSGYNLSASELAAGLAQMGHHVFYLRSGMDYSLRPGIHVKRFESWRGVECFDLFNAPNLSPAAANFGRLATELTCPAQSSVVLAWLAQIDAEVVHVHSLEGYPLDLIGAMRRAGYAVVVTPHNYWYACPQVDLLHKEREVCMDFEGGQRCVGCLTPEAGDRVLARRKREQTMVRLFGLAPYQSVRQVWLFFKKHATRSGRAKRPVKSVPPPLDPEIGMGFEVGDHAAHPGTIEHNLRLDENDKIVSLGRSPLDQNERFLSGEHHLVVLNEFGKRRSAGIEALNQANLVIPPSRFVLNTFLRMGMRPEIGRHVRLGQVHFDQLHRLVKRSPFYRVRPWSPESERPLRFAFHGTVRNNKGLEILASAIPLLPKEVRQRCHFQIRAAGWDWTFRKRLSVYPEVQFCGGYDMLQLVASVGEYDAGILPHVWFENSPLVLLEHLHAGKFVVASRLGGPPEWINEGKNGMLFPAGVPEALASCIMRLVSGEVAVPSPEEIHRASVLRSYPDHVREVSGIYAEALGVRAGQRASNNTERNAEAGLQSSALGAV
ncbi:MAG: glycosyltransferase [Phycisphaeraceae bacterium]|nr:MAG: glycosyltransferase [Phycisphaeraceae bacterium]